MLKPITFDNARVYPKGISSGQFVEHMEVATVLNCKTYFTRSYHSWEREQNKNKNGLLRQYLPKAMELHNAMVEIVIEVIHKLNSIPRKCLGWKIPYEVFEEPSGIDARIVIQGIR